MGKVMATQPQSLLDSMLRLIRSKGVQADRVTGYRERSYNIGYCETCYDMASDVRIYYVQADGTEGHWQADYTSLGDLIRELTDDDGQRALWDRTAVHESEDERFDRFNVHSFDEEA